MKSGMTKEEKKIDINTETVNVEMKEKIANMGTMKRTKDATSITTEGVDFAICLKTFVADKKKWQPQTATKLHNTFRQSCIMRLQLFLYVSF